MLNKDRYEAKHQTESTSLNFLNDSKVFVEYSNDVDDIYENI